MEHVSLFVKRVSHRVLHNDVAGTKSLTQPRYKEKTTARFSSAELSKMPPAVDHRRTHNLLLISRLLGLRDTVSPFTLLLDSLSQSSRPLVCEYIERATVPSPTLFPPLAVKWLLKRRKKNRQQNVKPSSSPSRPSALLRVSPPSLMHGVNRSRRYRKKFPLPAPSIAAKRL